MQKAVKILRKLSFNNENAIKSLQYSPFVGKNDEPVKYSGIPEILENSDISFLHYHNELEIGYCMEGTGTCVIGEKIYTFSAGDYIIIAPNIPHYHKAISADDCVCDFIFFDFEKMLSVFKIDTRKTFPFFDTNIPSQIIRANNTEELRTPLKDIIKLAADYEHTKSLSEILICFFLLSERLKKYGLPLEFAMSDSNDSKLTPAISLIALEYASDLDIEDLANACYMSKSHFMKVFNNTFGISAYAYLNRFRVYAAREMLIHTDYSIAYIGESCGFNSFSNFFRQFKKYFNISPSECRDENNSNKTN